MKSAAPVKIGIVGLGRLGKRHAANLRYQVPGGQLAAACSIAPEELSWAEEELGITELYSDYDEMLNKADLDAVFLVTSSAMHAAQAIKALDRGLHVFTEKPMGVNVDECRQVEQAAARNGEKVFFVGFVRRYDPSYAYAKKLIEEEVIGEPFMVRSQTVDLDEYADFQVEFVPASGGIFLDMNVHDIDLARWFLGSEVKTVYARGGSYVHKAFEDVNDADNTVVLAGFEDGKMAVISASRTAFHGHDTHTEISGSRGILKIGMTPAKNRVEVFDAYGARQDCVKDFFERFSEGFLNEAREFVNCIREGRKPGVSANDGTKATEVGFAMTDSFRQGKEISI
ncbi:MAG: inositol 2-dehydrogenase [Spirochaetes bacterium]|nr:MAG: inositol 2-dehydrogenase [Spirochaetota bacterium]RKX91186.1 MAG: inositol 2-dehydrogenase [Spirochaetota bacterium]